MRAPARLAAAAAVSIAALHGGARLRPQVAQETECAGQRALRGRPQLAAGDAGRRERDIGHPRGEQPDGVEVPGKALHPDGRDEL